MEEKAAYVHVSSSFHSFTLLLQVVLLLLLASIEIYGLIINVELDYVG